MRLHRIVGRARMCGPSAMSAVTGLLTHDCSALLREVTGRTQIHGVQGYELMAAMALAGWRCERTLHRGASRPTLAAWLRGHDTFADSFVLVMRRHFIALGDGEIADSGWMYDRRPQPAATAPAPPRARAPDHRMPPRVARPTPSAGAGAFRRAWSAPAAVKGGPAGAADHRPPDRSGKGRGRGGSLDWRLAGADPRNAESATPRGDSMNRQPSIEPPAAIGNANRTFAPLCRDLAAEQLRPEDFDPEVVSRLREAPARTEPHPGSFAYAGVGSRRTPPDILDAMADIAQTLGDAGTALSTGGAHGADKAFETGALRTDAPITVHAPWPGYNGYRPGRDPETDIDIVHPKSTKTVAGHGYADLAREHHPRWNRCSRGARTLFVRNVSILAGAVDDGGTLPVRAVIAWTPNGLAVGREAGGTGHTLRTAASLDIPCVNLSPRTPPERNAAALAAVPRVVREAVLGRVPGLPR